MWRLKNELGVKKSWFKVINIANIFVLQFKLQENFKTILNYKRNSEQFIRLIENVYQCNADNITLAISTICPQKQDVHIQFSWFKAKIILKCKHNFYLMLTDFFLKGYVLKKFDWIDHGGKVGPSPVTQDPHNSGTPGPLGPLVLSWKNWSQSWDPGSPWNLLYPRDSRTPETTETLGPQRPANFLWAPEPLATVSSLQLQFHLEDFHVKFTSNGCFDKIWWKSRNHIK